SGTGSNGSYTIKFNVQKGTFDLATVDILLNGKSVKSESIGGSGGTVTATVTVSSSGTQNVTVNVRDQGYYTVSRNGSFNATGNSEEGS
ncbi:hypothetical protein B7Z17_01105, partial [Candidatus Saccharibacteria bacterium 32-49-10]